MRADRVTMAPKYRAVLARSADRVEACLALRAAVFRGTAGLSDRDRFDDICEHMAVERVDDGRVVACFRFMSLERGAAVDDTYSAQFYELSALREFASPMIEMGRFCVDPGVRDADILRVAWGAMARIVEARGAGLIFGCSSFAGTDERRYYDAFAMLRDRHIAPSRWLPRIKAPRVFEFARRLRRSADPKAAMRAMPPLLKTYLAMGGWVSDHAVVDRDLGTLHVFTGVEIGAIPPARRRSLLAGS